MSDDEIELAGNDDDYTEFATARQRRVKVVAWIVIAALLITGGGATLFALLPG